MNASTASATADRHASLAKASARRLSAAEIAGYRRDGFVRLPGLFAADEIEPLAEACRADPEIGGALVAIADSSGKAQEVVSWSLPSDDFIGVLPRLARIVEAAEDLIGGPVYHWHSKLSMKRPGSEGRWDWHQDYGYWYYDGCLAPDLTTCMIAIDATSVENGCVKLVRGSHLLGRIDHARVGEASGVDPQRLAKILESHAVVDCEMAPGDAVFFHSNTLHASGPNRSNRPRTILHCSYNASDNAPIVTEGQEHHRYRPLEILPDSALRERRYGSIFDTQQFNVARPGQAVNLYGYKVLRHSRHQPAPR
jgi:ectoine hydroxylase-related dioxygenase (phytanoyl-CoA dioxygenase family)